MRYFRWALGVLAALVVAGSAFQGWAYLNYRSAQRALGVTFPIVVTTTTGTDHQAFRPTFPAVGLTEGYRSGDTSPYRHTAMDTFSTVDLDYLRSATVLATRTMADLLR